MTGGAPSVSLIVLNRDRPHLLARALAGIDLLTYPNFELLVVGDRGDHPGLAAAAGLAGRLRYLVCEDANISRARNIGIAAAAGEIVAFCDDDAVPEPDWLEHLVLPFADPRVGAAGGAVRAQDGIGFESRGVFVTPTAEEEPIPWPAAAVEDPAPRVFPPAPRRQAGFMGVNSAFRRGAIRAIGGFDESFRYYLDETDALMRLGRAGWSVALAPAAEVHHLRHANPVRGRLKRPRDLYEVAASTAYFCRRHAGPGDAGAALARFRARRRSKIDWYFCRGLLTVVERTQALQRLEDGLRDGAGRRPILPLDPEAGEAAPFAQFGPTGAQDGCLRIALVSGGGFGAGDLAGRVAQGLAGLGHAVSCFFYKGAGRPPTVSFDAGLWRHEGSTWRLDLGLGLAPAVARATGARLEVLRVSPRRRFDAAIRPAAPAFAVAGPPVATLAPPGRGPLLAVEALSDRFASSPPLIALLNQDVRRALGLDPGGVIRADAAAGAPAAAISSDPATFMSG